MRIDVAPDKERLAFPLKIRIPGWATGTRGRPIYVRRPSPARLKNVSVSINDRNRRRSRSTAISGP